MSKLFQPTSRSARSIPSPAAEEEACSLCPEAQRLRPLRSRSPRLARDPGGAVPRPAVAGVILNEDRLRVTLFVNPRLLTPTAEGATGFLPTPDRSLSLASNFGLSLSGSGNRAPLYQAQTRNVLALGPARIRSNVALASGYGVLVDDLVDSRWSLAEAARVLREAGAQGVLPLVLAQAG